MTKYQKHIFISYHHDDVGFAKNLIKRIELEGYETWVDNNRLQGGADWRETIDRAIRDSFALVVIMTPDAKTSDYVTYEWAYAWGAGVKVIPVLYKDTNLHPRLEALQYINFTNSRSRHWQHLIRAIKMAEHQQDASIPYPPPIKEDEDVVILRKEIVYEYLPDGKSMTQRKRLKMQMLKDNIKSYKDRYRWTGKGKCVLKPIQTDFRIINQHKGDDGMFDYFEVLFPKTTQKGDIVDFTMEWELIDEEGIAIPFLSTMIDAETKSLLLQVNLPSEPKGAYFEEYENFTQIEPSVTKVINWNLATRNLRYEISDPQLKHKYRIRWFN
ncbi:MAG TPA: toll/interleukin-1 receptor domain-containing protein [Methylomirabilota bacterium]|nr:toll/interleukin-1 receptor domain-containing protein [Methylomirabilota bacterium]